ncbi:MAG: hypothetical protein PVG03_06180 [Desulfarculaceae bacterium]
MSAYQNMSGKVGQLANETGKFASDIYGSGGSLTAAISGAENDFSGAMGSMGEKTRAFGGSVDAVSYLTQSAFAFMSDRALGFFDDVEYGAEHVLRGIFTGEINSLEDVWDGLMDVFQGSFDSMLNDIASSLAHWATSALTDTAKAGINSLLGEIGLPGMGGSGTVLTIPGIAGGNFPISMGGGYPMNLIGGQSLAMPGGGNFTLPGMGGGGGGFGNSLFDMGPLYVTAPSTVMPAFSPTMGAPTLAQWSAWDAATSGGAGFFGQGGWAGTGLTGAGAAMTGIGGALTGWQVSQMLWGQGAGSQIGGAVGGAGGGIAGAAIGTAVMPGIGTMVGAMLGGMMGGAGLGGLGSLFDEDKAREAIEAFERFQDNLGAGVSSWEDYSSLVSDFHKSDNRASQMISSEELRAMALEQGMWYAPDAYEVSHLGGQMDEGYWMAEGMGMGDMAGMADPEALTLFREAMAGINEDLGPIATGLQGVFEGLDVMNMSATEVAATLGDALNPALQIENQLTESLNEGMSLMDAHKQALSGTIETLLGSVNMEADTQNQMVDLLMRESGTVDELMGKYTRYQEIVQTLQNAHQLSKDEVVALVEEGRGLRGELGMQQTDFQNLDKSVKDITTAITELAKQIKKLENKEITITANFVTEGAENIEGSHSGGLMYHSGGMVPGGSLPGVYANWPRYHTGARVSKLAHDEVPIILQRGEYVVRRDSVNASTLPLLQALNQSGGAGLDFASERPVNLHVEVHGNILGGEENMNELARVIESKLVELDQARM